MRQMCAFLEKIRIRLTTREYYRSELLAKVNGFEIGSLESVLGVSSGGEALFDDAASDAMEKRALELFEERKRLASINGK